MTSDHAGCLFWLEYLDMSDKDQKELATKIHADWDAATEQGETLTVMDCQWIALSFWSRVREVEITMAGH